MREKKVIQSALLPYIHKILEILDIFALIVLHVAYVCMCVCVCVLKYGMEMKMISEPF